MVEQPIGPMVQLAGTDALRHAVSVLMRESSITYDEDAVQRAARQIWAEGLRKSLEDIVHEEQPTLTRSRQEQEEDGTTDGPTDVSQHSRVGHRRSMKQTLPSMNLRRLASIAALTAALTSATETGGRVLDPAAARSVVPDITAADIAKFFHEHPEKLQEALERVTEGVREDLENLTPDHAASEIRSAQPVAQAPAIMEVPTAESTSSPVQPEKSTPQEQPEQPDPEQSEQEESPVEEQSPAEDRPSGEQIAQQSEPPTATAPLEEQVEEQEQDVQTPQPEEDDTKIASDLAKARHKDKRDQETPAPLNTPLTQLPANQIGMGMPSAPVEQEDDQEEEQGEAQEEPEAASTEEEQAAELQKNRTQAKKEHESKDQKDKGASAKEKAEDIEGEFTPEKVGSRAYLWQNLIRVFMLDPIAWLYTHAHMLVRQLFVDGKIPFLAIKFQEPDILQKVVFGILLFIEISVTLMALTIIGLIVYIYVKVNSSLWETIKATFGVLATYIEGLF